MSYNFNIILQVCLLFILITNTNKSHISQPFKKKYILSRSLSKKSFTSLIIEYGYGEIHNSIINVVSTIHTLILSDTNNTLSIAGSVIYIFSKKNII